MAADRPRHPNQDQRQGGPGWIWLSVRGAFQVIPSSHCARLAAPDGAHAPTLAAMLSRGARPFRCLRQATLSVPPWQADRPAGDHKSRDLCHPHFARLGGCAVTCGPAPSASQMWGKRRSFIPGLIALLVDFGSDWRIFPHCAFRLVLACCPLIAHAATLALARHSFANAWRGCYFTRRRRAWRDRAFMLRMSSPHRHAMRDDALPNSSYEGPVAYYQLSNACRVSALRLHRASQFDARGESRWRRPCAGIATHCAAPGIDHHHRPLDLDQPGDGTTCATLARDHPTPAWPHRPAPAGATNWSPVAAQRRTLKSAPRDRG